MKDYISLGLEDKKTNGIFHYFGSRFGISEKTPLILAVFFLFMFHLFLKIML